MKNLIKAVPMAKALRIPNQGGASEAIREAGNTVLFC